MPTVSPEGAVDGSQGPASKAWPLGENDRKQGGRLVLASLAVAILALGAAQWMLHGLAGRPLHATIGVLFVAGLFAYGAAVLGSRGGASLRRVTESVLPRAQELTLLSLVLIIGVFFRTYALDRLPDGLNHDAAWEGMYAIEILRGLPYTPYTSEAFGHETLYKYLIATIIEWIGVERMAIVLPSTLVGISTLPVFYLFVRVLLGNRVALMSVFLLAVSGWHWVFSRTGWRAILTPFFECLALGALWYGLERPRARWAFVLAGVGIAGSLNSYNAARIVPVMVLVPIVVRLVRGRRAFLRTHFVGMAYLLISSALLSAPMLWYAANNWDTWMGRAQAVWTGSGGLLHNLRDGLLVFNYRGNGDDFIIETPILEAVPAVLLTMGVVYCLLHLRQEKAIFLLTALGLALLPGLLTKPNANRAIAALPIVYALCGLGLALILELLDASRDKRRWRVAVLVGALSLAAALTSKEYLGAARRPIWGYYPETLVVARHLKSFVPDTEIHFAAGNYPRDTMTFISYSGEGPPIPHYHWHDDPTEVLRVRPAGDRDLLFIVEIGDRYQALHAGLERLYVEHESEELRHPDAGGRVFARAYHVSRDALARVDLPALDDEALPRPLPRLFAAAPEGSRDSLRGAKDLDVCAAGQVVIADTGNHRIQLFSATGELLLVWGRKGSGEGEFHEPHAVDCDEEGTIWVLDSWNGRIQRFSSTGEFTGSFSRPDGLYGPRAFAVSGETIYIVDTGNRRVSVHSRDGLVTATWGPDRVDLSHPVGVVADESGSVFIVDSGHNRIVELSPDGVQQRAWAVPGWSGDGLKEGYLESTPEGVWLTDPVAGQVILFDRQGDVQRTIPTMPGATGIAMRGSECMLTASDRVLRIPC